MISVLVPVSLKADEAPWWNNDWLFRTEIKVPIDTINDEAKFQPVDVRIDFNNTCWAKSESENSVRVIYQDGDRFIELESQIYDLKFSDSEHISSCNVVFLIPQEANGKERYYVYYDDKQKTGPNYKKHVDISESYYQYGPIQGLTFESSFYKITQDGYLVYAINKKGTAFGDTISQQITKLKEDSVDVKPSNGEQLLSLSLAYWWHKDNKWYGTSASQELVSKQIFVDGNLMIKFGIVSQSSDGLLRTTVIYKYYYCPTQDKRIYAHVKHEVIGYPLPLGDEIDVAYMILPCGGIKSSTNEELNFGEIPHYLHFLGDENRVITFKMDQCPETSNWQKMIGKEDNYTLGNQAWLSVDHGETGNAQAVIFESNKVLKSGKDERDGIELQLRESHNIQLPGLDGRFAYLYVMRNASYENGVPNDEVLPEDYVVEFNAEFFTTENGGYPTVEKESSMYQSLIGYQADNGSSIENGNENETEYTLTAYAHLPITLLPKIWGIKSLLKNTYISAELFNENELIAYGKVNRILLTEDVHIDWKNISLFRKIKFEHLPQGKYLVRIWLNNPLVGYKSEFIGYESVDLQKNTTVHLFCKPEGRLSVSINNQDGSGVENVQIRLIKDGNIIAENSSNPNGKVVIVAPCGLRENYTLDVLYKGFLVSEENIRLGRIRSILPLTKKIKLDIHDLKIDFKDAKKKTPTFSIDLALTSDEMKNPISIVPDSLSEGKYYFNNLYPANYTLSIKYDQFEIKEKVQIPNTGSLSIELHDFTVSIKDDWNLPPEATLDVSLASKDFEKVVVLPGEEISLGEYLFSDLYPGNYTLKVGYMDYNLEGPVSIPYGANDEETIVFSAEFNVTAKVFDTHGNPLSNAKVLMIRGEGKSRNQTQGITDGDGSVTFSLPPGSYQSEIYSGDSLVAKREIDVLAEKTSSVVTTSEPLLPMIVIGAAAIMIIGALLIGYKRRNVKFFLKIFAIGIAMVALFSPWWAIYGSSDGGLETSTKLFLMPTKMVTITSNGNVTAGEISSLDERFTSVTNILPIVIAVGFLCIIASILLNKYSRRKISFVVFLLAGMIFVGSAVTFCYAMTELANTSVGSFNGNGNIDIAIPGEKMYETVSCSWGPSIGFYLFFVSVVVLAFVFCLDLRKILSNRIKKRYTV